MTMVVLSAYILFEVYVSWAKYGTSVAAEKYLSYKLAG